MHYAIVETKSTERQYQRRTNAHCSYVEYLLGMLKVHLFETLYSELSYFKGFPRKKKLKFQNKVLHRTTPTVIWNVTSTFLAQYIIGHVLILHMKIHRSHLIHSLGKNSKRGGIHSHWKVRFLTAEDQLYLREANYLEFPHH